MEEAEEAGAPARELWSMATSGDCSIRSRAAAGSLFWIWGSGDGTNADASLFTI